MPPLMTIVFCWLLCALGAFANASDEAALAPPLSISLVKSDNPILRKHALDIPLEFIDGPFLNALIDQMVVLLKQIDGCVGVAAPQVGFSYRLFIASEPIFLEGGGYYFSEPRVFINPEVLVEGEERQYKPEGCLSVPGARGVVPRPVAVRVKARDEHGRLFDMMATGDMARIIMHEYDHLQGVLVIDSMLVE